MFFVGEPQCQYPEVSPLELGQLCEEGRAGCGVVGAEWGKGTGCIGLVNTPPPFLTR